MTGAVKDYVKKWALRGSILEIGSRDINGTVRDLFSNEGGSYVGVDIVDGPGVDQMMNGNRLKFKPDTFDMVLLLEMLEHDEQPWKTVSEAIRVLKPGGRLILTVPWFFFPPHEEPDLWRFSGNGVKVLLKPLHIIDLVESIPFKHVFAVADKGGQA